MARLASGNLNGKRSNPSHFRAEVQSSRQLFDDESDNSILDCAILERPASGSSTHAMGHQREPITDEAPVLSPRDGRWSDFSFPADSTAHLQSSNMAGALFFDHSGQTFIHGQSVPGSMYTPQTAGWQSSGDQDACTSATAYEGFSSDLDPKALGQFHHEDPANVPPPGVYGGLPVGQPQFYGASALATSPPSGQDWSSISSTEHIDFQSMHRAGPLSSPPYNANPPLLRRDGIRKKNARFEIPAERTLRNIDQMISQTTDEAQIKELKQQKRLLRNRQAALDSRQRKKQHTERLEEEKKATSSMLSDLEDALADMKLREDSWTQERESMLQYHRQQRQAIERLVAEKEELVRRHTIETAELRKKNAYLADQAQKLDGIAMSAVPSSTGYSADYSDFENLTMESSPWNQFSLVTDFNMESKHEANNDSIGAPKKESHDEKEGTTAAASGLLLMLLLCGAWVVSNNSTANSRPIPRMPEDVRMASTAVLDTLYSDSGVQPQESDALRHLRNEVLGHNATHQASPHPSSAGQSHSPLATLHRQLISPNEQQQRDQIFSLSVQHYNGVTTDDAMMRSTSTAPTRRRNLGDALVALRSSKYGSAADAYTRSLMWNEVPTSVVRDFARMVAEAQHESQEPLV
ncbi:MAG: hypothetical protein Q9207_002462 [Kuettlingeria erythrocarpa]